jgi:hypothetical protein
MIKLASGQTAYLRETRPESLVLTAQVLSAQENLTLVSHRQISQVLVLSV